MLALTPATSDTGRQ